MEKNVETRRPHGWAFRAIAAGIATSIRLCFPECGVSRSQLSDTGKADNATKGEAVTLRIFLTKIRMKTSHLHYSELEDERPVSLSPSFHAPRDDLSSSLRTFLEDTCTQRQ